MAKLFHRTYRLQVDTLVVDQLRVVFKIEKSVSKHPNKAEIQIYNLSEDSRKRTQKLNAQVTLDAGYPDTVARIFTGKASKVSHVRAGGDWITKIICGDGEHEIRSFRISESMGPGSTVVDILKKAAGAMNVREGNLLTELGKGDFAKGLFDASNGKVLNGLASNELDKVLKSIGYTWSIQDGALQLLKPGTATTQPTILLDSGSGLIGSPEYGETGKDKHLILKAKCLLNPGLVPGRKLQLKSETKDGYFVVSKVVFTGDSIGGGSPWYSELELLKLATSN